MDEIKSNRAKQLFKFICLQIAFVQKYARYPIPKSIHILEYSVSIRETQLPVGFANYFKRKIYNLTVILSLYRFTNSQEHRSSSILYVSTCKRFYS